MSVKPKKSQSHEMKAVRPESAQSADLETSSPFTETPSQVPPLDNQRIARARQLLREDGYPSEKILQSIAQHLARNWADAGGAPVVLPPPRS